MIDLVTHGPHEKDDSAVQVDQPLYVVRRQEPGVVVAPLFEYRTCKGRRQ